MSNLDIEELKDKCQTAWRYYVVVDEVSKESVDKAEDAWNAYIVACKDLKNAKGEINV